jgi:hypothetical protein
MGEGSGDGHVEAPGHTLISGFDLGYQLELVAVVVGLVWSVDRDVKVR